MKKNIAFLLAISGLLLTSNNAFADKAASNKKAATAKQATPVPSVEVDDSKVVARLPQLPEAKLLSPSLMDVQGWDNHQRSDYVHDARSHVADAEHQVQAAERLLKQAQSVTRSLMPNNRAYGESEDHFKDRYAAADKRVKELLQPFQDYVSLAQRNLATAHAIEDVCWMAYRGYTGNWQPVGGTGH